MRRASYAPDRRAERPIAHLAGFKGVLQVDGYGGYRVLAERGDVRLAFCWSHVRRRFYELAQAGPAPIASEALARIAALYRIESEITGQSADQRRNDRQERSRPLVEALEPWLREKLSLISQKTKLAEAIFYALARWAGLRLFHPLVMFTASRTKMGHLVAPRWLTAICAPIAAVIILLNVNLLWSVANAAE
jgi:hypothetical protein